MSSGIGIGIGIGLDNNNSVLNQFQRANRLVNLFQSSRVPIMVVGDSNMAQVGGNHWGGLRIALKSRYGTYGTRLASSPHYSIGTDAAGTAEGLTPGAHAADFRYVDDGDDSDILDKTCFTKTEFDACQLTADDLSFLSDPTVIFCNGFVAPWYRLPTGSYCPADRGLGTGSNWALVDQDNPTLGDLTSVMVRTHVSYKIPSSDPGTWHPNYRIAFSGTNLTSPALTYDTATDGIDDVTITLAANASTTARSFQDQRIFENEANGDLYLGTYQLTNPAVLTGVSVCPFYYVGGYGLVHFARDLNWLMATHPGHLQEFMREMNRGVKVGNESFVFWNKFKGNDLGYTIPAYDIGDAPGENSGSAANTKLGYKRNLQTVVEILYNTWVGAGYSPSRFWVVDGGNFPTEATLTGQQTLLEGAIELSESTAHPAHRKIIVIKGNLLTTEDEMDDLGWYDTGVGGGPSAHLSGPGFRGYNEREVEALADLAMGIPQTQQGT